MTKLAPVIAALSALLLAGIEPAIWFSAGVFVGVVTVCADVTFRREEWLKFLNGQKEQKND